jgi:hypothetical protein
MSTIQPTCPHCSQPMKLVRDIPAVGPAWPALLVFFCSACSQADTREDQSIISSTSASVGETPVVVYPSRIDWGALS